MGECGSLSFLKCYIFLLEPTHEMYLNWAVADADGNVAILEPTHEMYLN